MLAFIEQSQNKCDVFFKSNLKEKGNVNVLILFPHIYVSTLIISSKSSYRI